MLHLLINELVTEVPSMRRRKANVPHNLTALYAFKFSLINLTSLATNPLVL